MPVSATCDSISALACAGRDLAGQRPAVPGGHRLAGARAGGARCCGGGHGCCVRCQLAAPYLRRTRPALSMDTSYSACDTAPMRPSGRLSAHPTLCVALSTGMSLISPIDPQLAVCAFLYSWKLGPGRLSGWCVSLLLRAESVIADKPEDIAVPLSASFISYRGASDSESTDLLEFIGPMGHTTQYPINAVVPVYSRRWMTGAGRWRRTCSIPQARC